MIGALSSFRATEAVLTTDGELLFVTNVNSDRLRNNLVVLQPPLNDGERTDLVVLSRGRFLIRGEIDAGPVSWGVVDQSTYMVYYSDWGGAISRVQSLLLADRLRDAEDGREGEDEDEELINRMTVYLQEYGRESARIDSFLRDLDATAAGQYMHSGMWFDLAYTRQNHVSAIAIFDAFLYWWTFNKPEEERWTDRGRVSTQINSVFRIVQAGEDMYLIDAEGRVLTGPGAGHAQVGEIEGWNLVLEDETVILLEEQVSEKILVAKMVEGVPVVLPFAGDLEAAADFMVDIPDPDLRAGLMRMEQILEEAAEPPDGE